MASGSILLVDDDEPFRTVVGRALKARGYCVAEAAEGAQALRSLEADAPDILITDIIMPGGDGFELISAARRSVPGTSIVAISGRGQLGALDLLKLATMIGADVVLAKPFSAEELAEALERLGGTAVVRRES